MNLNELDHIADEEQLDDILSFPQPRVVDMMSRLEGDLIVLGAGGKMGVSLATQARRAGEESAFTGRVMAVSRFSDARARKRLDDAGVETIVCDLLNTASVGKLPKAPNVIYMAGRKFGTGADAGLTWAMNVEVPAVVCRHFSDSRVVAFSTGCVYPFVSADSGGCDVSTPPEPVGEYAMSCLGRERMFEHFAILNRQPMCLVRLNYAIDLRYGVIHDVASAIHAGRPVDLSMAHFNMIWQGDANAIALLQLEHCESPPAVINLTGPDILETKEVALQLGRLMDREVRFAGSDAGAYYLCDARPTLERSGGLSVSVETMLRWNARWVQSGGRSLNKPTHFEVSDGSY